MNQASIEIYHIDLLTQYTAFHTIFLTLTFQNELCSVFLLIALVTTGNHPGLDTRASTVPEKIIKQVQYPRQKSAILSSGKINIIERYLYHHT